MRSPIKAFAIFVALAPLSTSFSAQAQAGAAPPGPPPPPADATPPPQPPPEKAPPAEPPAEEAPPAESAPPAEGGAEAGAEEGEGEDPARPPPKGKGVVWGVVTDTKLGEPIIEGQVTVVGTKYKTLTDIDGRYRLELPPGTYNLRVFYELHGPVRIDGVKVAAGQVVKFDAKLTPDEEAVETMEVETEADRAALEGQTLTRQRSAAVGDSVGRAEIAKTPDRNAAQSAQRVVGATIVGNRFVYVRGLGERYTNALLNGTPLPSPEPDVNAVPLDLFPSLILESVTIAKTFTPDVPGDFAGGSVRIETREIPGKLLFSPSISFGYNSQSTFRERLSYRGSDTDWLGFDSGLRELPDDIPDYKLVRNGDKPGTTEKVGDADLKPAGESINTFMSSQRSLTPPNFGLSLVVGDGFQLGGEQRLGFLAAVNYSRSFVIRDEVYREYSNDGSKNVDFNLESGIDSVRWGAFGSLTYQLAKGQRLILTGLRSQLSDNTARISDGTEFKGSNGLSITHQTRLSFISRELSYGQLRGEHQFKALNDGELGWNVSIAHAGRDEPDTRDDVWERQPEDTLETRLRFSGSNAQAGRHLYADQGEIALGAGLDYTQPLLEAPRDTKLKFGGLVSLRSREFRARRFNFQYGPAYVPGPMSNQAIYCPGPRYNEGCADALFKSENIGTLIELNESTDPATDAYDADLNIYAAYFMGDISLTRDLRVIAGERLEVTRQSVDPFDQFNSGAKVESANLKSTDLLPALALVYSATKQSKVRASVTRTLARPQLRELAPFPYNEIVGGRTISGFPGLKLTKILNADLRFEYFPTLREVLAFSVFMKDFKDPIEPLIFPTGGSNTQSFRNSPGAILIGIELEARKSLEMFVKQLKEFSLIANLTLAKSRIEVEQTAENFITNTSRPLVNQAPYVLNIALDYAGEHGTNARLLYNVIGARVVAVGTGGLDDAYQHPRHAFDVALSQDFGDHFGLKLTAENILNAETLITQGKESRDDNIVRKYTDGTTYTISVQYTY